MLDVDVTESRLVLHASEAKEIEKIKSFFNNLEANWTGQEQFFLALQLNITKQAASVFVKKYKGTLDYNFKTFAGCLKAQVSLNPNPSHYVGLVRLLEDYLRAIED